MIPLTKPQIDLIDEVTTEFRQDLLKGAKALLAAVGVYSKKNMIPGVSMNVLYAAVFKRLYSRLSTWPKMPKIMQDSLHFWTDFALSEGRIPNYDVPGVDSVDPDVVDDIVFELGKWAVVDANVETYRRYWQLIRRYHREAREVMMQPNMSDSEIRDMFGTTLMVVLMRNPRMATYGQDAGRILRILNKSVA